MDSFVSLRKQLAFSVLESGKQFHRLVEPRALFAGEVGIWQEPLPRFFLGPYNQWMITGHTGVAAPLTGSSPTECIIWKPDGSDCNDALVFLSKRMRCRIYTKKNKVLRTISLIIIADMLALPGMWEGAQRYNNACRRSLSQPTWKDRKVDALYAGFLHMFKFQINDNARGRKQVVWKLHLVQTHFI